MEIVSVKPLVVHLVWNNIAHEAIAVRFVNMTLSTISAILSLTHSLAGMPPFAMIKHLYQSVLR